MVTKRALDVPSGPVVRILSSLFSKKSPSVMFWIWPWTGGWMSGTIRSVTLIAAMCGGWSLEKQEDELMRDDGMDGRARVRPLDIRYQGYVIGT